jgi:hypothetical protein
MADQPKTNRGAEGDFHNIPVETGVHRRYVDITAMIRSLQRTEGLTDCFRRGLAGCEHRECSWRQYCVEETDDEYES